MKKRVHSEFNGLHIWNNEPKWYHDTRYETSYCEVDGCWRFADLPCRSCKFQRKPYAKPTTGLMPFVHVILCLVRKGIPRHLASWIAKNYIVLPTTVVLTCPYVKVGSRVYHDHCTSKKAKHRHEYADAEMAFFRNNVITK